MGIGGRPDPVVDAKITGRIEAIPDGNHRYIIRVIFLTEEAVEFEVNHAKFIEMLHAVAEQEMQAKFFRP
jgi:hypothetical protein